MAMVCSRQWRPARRGPKTPSPIPLWCELQSSTSAGACLGETPELVACKPLCFLVKSAPRVCREVHRNVTFRTGLSPYLAVKVYLMSAAGSSLLRTDRTRSGLAPPSFPDQTAAL